MHNSCSVVPAAAAAAVRNMVVVAIEVMIVGGPVYCSTNFANCATDVAVAALEN